jgi:hypothetical protein
MARTCGAQPQPGAIISFFPFFNDTRHGACSIVAFCILFLTAPRYHDIYTSTAVGTVVRAGISAVETMPHGNGLSDPPRLPIFRPGLLAIGAF